MLDVTGVRFRMFAAKEIVFKLIYEPLFFDSKTKNVKTFENKISYSAHFVKLHVHASETSEQNVLIK